MSQGKFKRNFIFVLVLIDLLFAAEFLTPVIAQNISSSAYLFLGSDPATATGTVKMFADGFNGPPAPFPATYQAAIQNASSPNLALGAYATTSRSGPLNLALSAAASASGVWWWEYWRFSPAFVNDGDPMTVWGSQFWEYWSWVRITWPQPVTFSKIRVISVNPDWACFITGGYIGYYDAFGGWHDIPNSSFAIGNNPNAPTYPSEFIVEFPPVTGSSVQLNTFSLNHANYFSTIGELEVYGSSITVNTVEAIPGTLWIDQSGAGSGIVFRATTSEETTVSFKVRFSGQEYFLGSAPTVANGADHVAKLSWWGDLGGKIAPEGGYTIIAEAADSTKENTFVVDHVEGASLGMGKWVTAKDPKAVVPQDPSPYDCLQQSWPQLANLSEGYFDGLTISDPVNILSGNFLWSTVDFSVKSRIPLVLARVYNSFDSNVGPLGRGWSAPYLSRLGFLASDVIFINSDGSRVFFQNQGTTYMPPIGVELRLSLATDTGFWSITHPHGDEWTFDASGRIIRMVKACCGMGAADAVDIDYDAFQKLYRVSNSTGQWIEFSSNPEGRIVQIVDSAGRTVHYEYDEAGNLISFTDPIGRATVYEYNEDGFLTRITEPGNRTTNITYADRRVSMVTNPDGATSQFAWNYANPKLTLTDPDGIVHEYGFTTDWRFNSYTVPAMGITKSFISSGSALTGYTNALGNSSTYTYGTDGLLQTITDPMGN